MNLESMATAYANATAAKYYHDDRGVGRYLGPCPDDKLAALKDQAAGHAAQIRRFCEEYGNHPDLLRVAEWLHTTPEPPHVHMSVFGGPCECGAMLQWVKP